MLFLHLSAEAWKYMIPVVFDQQDDHIQCKFVIFLNRATWRDTFPCPNLHTRREIRLGPIELTMDVSDC